MNYKKMEQVQLQKEECGDKMEYLENECTGAVMDSDKKRRSSILKPIKPRNPLATLDFSEPNPDTTLARASRRVSFASSNFVKEFADDPEKNTIWDNTYEEEVNHTDSTKSSYEQTQDTKSVNFLNTTSIYAETYQINPVEVPHANASALKYENPDKENVNLIVNAYEELEFTMMGNKTAYSEHCMELTTTNINPEIQMGTVPTLDQTVLGQCDMELASILSAEIYQNFEEDANASGSDLDTKHATKRKNISFQSRDQMDISTASPNQGSILKKLRKLDSQGPDQHWVKSILQTAENIQKPTRNETLHFDYDNRDGDVDITNTLPDILKENVETSKDMRFASMLPNAEVIREPSAKGYRSCSGDSQKEIITKDVPINFNKTSADMSLTMALPSVVIVRETFAEHLPLPTEEKEIHFNETGGVDMSLTGVVPSAKIKDTSADMSLTMSLPSVAIVRETFAEHLHVGGDFTAPLPTEGTKIHCNETGCVDKSFLPRVKVKETNTDMRLSRTLPSVAIIREKTFAKHQNARRETVHFSEPLTPNLLKEGLESTREKMQTNQTDSDGMMSFSALPNSQVIAEKINNSAMHSEPVSQANIQFANAPSRESERLTATLQSAEDIENHMNVNCNTSKINMHSTAASSGANIANNTRSKTRSNLIHTGHDDTTTVPLKAAESAAVDNLKPNRETRNILYSEPRNIQLKAYNMHPIFDLSTNLQLQGLDDSLNLKLAPAVTPATSFHMSLTNMSPCIEDTQQLIHTTFSRPESVNEEVHAAYGNKVCRNIEVTGGHDTLSYSEENVATGATINVSAVNKKTCIGTGAEEPDCMDRSEEDFMKIYDSLPPSHANTERSCYLEDITPLDLAPNESILSSPDNSPEHLHQNSVLTANVSMGQLLSNVEKRTMLYTIDSSDDALNRAAELLRQFKVGLSAINETLQVLNTRPLLHVTDLEEEHKKYMEQLRNECEAEASAEEDENAPSMAGLAAPKSLYERVYEMGQRNEKLIKLLRVEDDYYCFGAYFGSLSFKVHVHPELGMVYNIHTESKLKNTAKPICGYNVQLLQHKLKMDNLSSVLGLNFEIITLLDYIYLSAEEIVNFHSEYNSLVKQYGRSHHFRMNPDYSVTIEVLDIDLIIFWVITIMLLPGRVVSKDHVTALAKLGESVNEDHVKSIAENAPKGPNFLRTYIEKLDEYVKRIEKKIKMKRGQK